MKGLCLPTEFMALLSIVLIAVMAISMYAGPSSLELPVIPIVQSVEFKAETFALSRLNIWVEEGISRSDLNQGLEELRPTLPLEDALSLDAANIIVQLLKYPPSSLADYQMESYYTLELSSKRITISALTSRGFFYGLMSLRQILANDPEHLPIGIIRDYPLMEIRGPSDDISRGQVSTLENFKEIIRSCGLYKMNYFFIYMEDVFELQSFPSIGKNRGRLTPVDIKELEDWGRKYFVEIVPIFQTLGHLENVLIEDEFVAMAEFPGSSSLSITDSSALAYLEKSIPEVSQAFSSLYFNIGADESFDVGKGENEALLHRHGIDYLHLQHYFKVFDLVRKQHKKIMMYADILQKYPEIFSGLPKDIILVYWAYQPNYIYSPSEKLKLTGNPFIVSPGIWNWRKIYPDHLSAMTNIENIIRDGYRNGAMGSIISSWGDFGGPNLREFNYYAYAYGADWAWNPLQADRRHFEAHYWRGRKEDAVLNHSLSILGNELSFKDYFDYPYQPENYAGRNFTSYNIRLETVYRLADQIMQLTETMALNRWKIYYQWVAGMGMDYYQIQSLMTEIYRIIHYEFDQPDFKQRLSDKVNACLGFARQVESRRQEYRKLWLLTNRADNLHRIEREFEYLTFFLNRIAEQLQAGKTDISGALPGDFITARKPDGNFSSKAYYRYNLRMDTRPTYAQMQLLAEGIATLWINGRQVGEVKAHHSGSLLVQQSRIKVWDVSSFLKEGINTLAIQGQSFRKDTILVHALLVWKDKSGQSHQLTTSNHWRASADTVEGWITSDACFEQWYWAEPQSPIDVYTRSFLENGFPSRIQK